MPGLDPTFVLSTSKGVTSKGMGKPLRSSSEWAKDLETGASFLLLSFLSSALCPQTRKSLWEEDWGSEGTVEQSPEQM
jgi:hypothetical protein